MRDLLPRAFQEILSKLSGLIIEAMEHKGFSIIDIHQPCVSFNKINTHLWYKQRVFDLKEAGHDSSDYEKAMQVARMGMDKIPTGVIYKIQTTPFHERLDVLKKQTLFLNTALIKRK